MSNSHRQQLVRWGEALAADFLIDAGYAILARNYRTPHGEIDLIAQQGSEIVFVEVKTRTSNKFGLPEQAVTPQKQAHMLASAQYYMQNLTELSGNWRIDVVAIRRLRDRPPEIVHFENILTA